MTEKTSEKKLLKRIFKSKEHDEPTTAHDIEKIVIEQNQSAKQIKKLADDIQQNQHKAAVDTNDLVSHIKHFKHTEKKRQKLTNQYIKQQREDPTLSPLKIVQTVNQELDPLPPYTETPSAPSANLYPELQANHTEIQTIDPFAPSTLCKSLQSLAIPDFSLDEPLSRNELALKNEVTAQTQLLNYYQTITSPHTTKIAQLLEKIQLLNQLQDRLPSFYPDENTLKTAYKNLTKTTLSSASHSQNTSCAPTPFTPDHSLFTTGSTTHDTPESQKPISKTPFLEYAHTPLNLIINALNELQINTHESHIHWEFQLNKLQDDLISDYLQQPTTTSLTRTETLQKFTKLHKLLHDTQKCFNEDTLEQNTTNTKTPQNSYRYLHLFVPPELQTTEKQLSCLQNCIKKVNTILQRLSPNTDHTLIKHYQIKLLHLDNLRTLLQANHPAQSAGFSSPTHPDKGSFHTPPNQPQPSLHPPSLVQTPKTNPAPIFYPEVNQTRFIPKMLLNPLELGDEIQWARLTQSTLEEFPYIDSKLKLKALSQHLMKHPAAKQAAAAQLLQAIQDPLHDPLNGFFTWLFQSYSLSRQEQNTNLRKAIEKQKFDWSNNPAIDLQNAIAQVHMSLNEINNNEIFRETLQDALKYKLQPYYHLVANTPIPDLPEKLRFIWKKIAVPTPNTKDPNPSSEPIILNTTTQTTPPKEINETSNSITPSQPPQNNMRESLMHEIKAIHKQIGRIHQIQSTHDQQRPQKKPETRACFRCGKIGHVAKFCRSKPQQPPPNRQNRFSPRDNTQRQQFMSRPNQWRRPFQQRHDNNHSNTNGAFRSNDNRQRRNYNNYDRQPTHNNNYNQQRFNRQPNNRSNSNSRNPNNRNQSHSYNPTTPRSNEQQTNKTRDSKNYNYSRPAQHAEEDFEPNLSAPQRWNTEVKRPPFPYDKAMAERAFAMHFDITPDSTTDSLPEQHFLEMTQSPSSPPT